MLRQALCAVGVLLTTTSAQDVPCDLTEDTCPPPFTIDIENCLCNCEKECIAPFVLIEQKCECLCRNACIDPFILNEDECECECPTNLVDCPPGTVLNEEKCACVPCPQEECLDPKVWDP